MLSLDFAIHHNDCLGTESTNRFPEVKSQVLSSIVAANASACVYMCAEADTPDDLTRYLEFWKNRTQVRRFDVFGKAGARALFRVLMTPKGKTVTRVVLDHEALFATPIPISSGLETWSVLLPEEGRASALFSDLQGVGAVEVKRARRVDLADLLSGEIPYLAGVSPRRLHILRFALEQGYFDYPRRVNSRELAMQLGLAQSTVLEHLRKAQREVLGQCLKGQLTDESSMIRLPRKVKRE